MNNNNLKIIRLNTELLPVIPEEGAVLNKIVANIIGVSEKAEILEGLMVRNWD